MRKIAIEGYDGSGKSTVAEAVAAALGGALVRHFPNDDGYTGKAIRAWLKGEWHVEVDGPSELDQKHVNAMVFQALQLVNRAELYEEITESKEHQVFVRYWQSGFVYGTRDALDGSWLRKAHAWLPPADLNILLDISPETALERQGVRGGKPEAYEGSLRTASNVTDKYSRLWEDHFEDPNWVVVDANKSLGSVIGATLREVFRIAPVR